MNALPMVRSRAEARPTRGVGASPVLRSPHPSPPPRGGGVLRRGAVLVTVDHPSKFTVSMIFSAAARVAAMVANGVASGVKSPQLCTSAERGTPALTGNS